MHFYILVRKENDLLKHSFVLLHGPFLVFFIVIFHFLIFIFQKIAKENNFSSCIVLIFSHRCYSLLCLPMQKATVDKFLFYFYCFYNRIRTKAYKSYNVKNKIHSYKCSKYVVLHNYTFRNKENLSL